MSTIPDSLFNRPISPGARLLGCLLWCLAVSDTPPDAVVQVSKSRLRKRLAVTRGTLDRHLRELDRAGLIAPLYAAGESKCTGWRMVRVPEHVHPTTAAAGTHKRETKKRSARWPVVDLAGQNTKPDDLGDHA